MSLATDADKFSQLNVGRVAGHERPHKPVMLLALLDLFEQGLIKREPNHVFPGTAGALWRVFQCGALPKMTSQLRSIPTFTSGVRGSGTIIRAPARRPSSARSARRRVIKAFQEHVGLRISGR